eukprot:g7736.t1
MTIGIVIVAAGRGERAGAAAEGPKQYRLIGGRPVIAHTLQAFLTWPHSGPIVVVIHPHDEALFAAAVNDLAAGGRVVTTFGGDTRQRSVHEGLRALSQFDASHVMIHDAARPFVDHELLDRIAEALASGCPAVLPAVAVTDTLKRGGSDGLVHETVPRSGLFAAQTPQSFSLLDIRLAHEKAAALRRDDFTDDAAIAEWAGLPVTIVEGSIDNVKLTVKRDIAMANEKLSTAPLPDVRTGNGYDVHQLVPGDGVTLCGVFIPHDQTLSGHSDADVALHALTDALLATCGAGDIGDHFPPSDMQWKGAPSKIFLEHAAMLVRKKGGVIMNADVSLIAEAPKVGPHRQTMRENLSAMLGISLDRCSMAIFPDEIDDLARRVVMEFSRGESTVATAESCTGGLIAAALTEVACSSAVVDRGFVTYSNAAKMDMLGVSKATLETHGAVSEETALQMVAGALYGSRATVAVAVTGIAGPGGGSDAKPVGLVHLAVGRRDGMRLHREMRYGDLGRSGIRLATVKTALDMLLEALEAP